MIGTKLKVRPMQTQQTARARVGRRKMDAQSVLSYLDGSMRTRMIEAAKLASERRELEEKQGRLAASQSMQLSA